MLDMMTDRYEIEEFQLASGLMPARPSYTAQLPGAPTAARAEPARQLAAKLDLLAGVHGRRVQGLRSMKRGVTNRAAAST